ncbi:hypothetical protein [Burkholderia metallica]|uniref:CBS domain-containing protein n=1 Tax=Burkholderia metallica TaxID=488729 RepID=A0ABT8PFX7_9BURK|nr:hypothetical protein [Burkholderia metallica]MDN7933363.1 hypothetical protein [Burkholderia metallica]VWB26341.1 CBS domain-containing protein [Burkholderia metallica]
MDRWWCNRQQPVARTDSIRHAAQWVERYDIGTLPMCDDNRVVGRMTSRDLAMRATERADVANTLDGVSHPQRT